MSYENLTAQMDRAKLAREHRAADQRWDDVDQLDAALADARSSYGDSFQMSVQTGNLARLMQRLNG